MDWIIFLPYAYFVAWLRASVVTEKYDNSNIVFGNVEWDCVYFGLMRNFNFGFEGWKLSDGIALLYVTLMHVCMQNLRFCGYRNFVIYVLGWLFNCLIYLLWNLYFEELKSWTFNFKFSTTKNSRHLWKESKYFIIMTVIIKPFKISNLISNIKMLMQF